MLVLAAAEGRQTSATALRSSMVQRALLLVATVCLPWLVLGSDAADTDFQERLKVLRGLYQRQEWPRVEQFLAKWAEAAPDDPEVHVRYGHYFRTRAKQESKVLTMARKREGSVVVAPLTAHDPNLLTRAANSYREGLRRASDRLDVRFALAHTLQQSGEFDAQLALLEETVSRVREHPGAVRWGMGPAPEAVERMMAVSLHDYATFYLAQPEEPQKLRGLKLAKLAASSYPESPLAHNDIAAYYSDRGEWAEAFKHLSAANRVAPRDSLVLFNLGMAAEKLGKIAQARRFYDRLIKLRDDPDLVEDAKERLRALK
jgi:tetratricopeptide (TPR) repeat protein